MKQLSSNMRTSEKGKSALKKEEDLRLKAYLCPAGKLTIGYGHTGADVYEGMTITKEQANALFEKDVVIHEKPVQNMGVKLNQNQFDALVSFVFNFGETRFRSSVLYEKVMANPDDATIADEFRRWINSGGKPSKGLIARREREIEMYFA